VPDSRFPITRLTLLGALGQGLRWEEFVALYGRLILYWLRRDFSLQDADAENVRQEVLVRVWRGVRGYDPSRGRFRHWLYTCTRNAALARRRPRETGGEDLLEPAAPGPGWPADEAGDVENALAALEQDGFDREDLQRAVLHVRGRVQAATWKAFLLFEFFDLSAREIGPRLGLSPAAVNQAVFRVRRLLQEALEEDAP
jgi:RNA polymerase sigma factor (sigma-70 family)